MLFYGGDIWWLVLVAFALDMLLGDPDVRFMKHPVCYVGEAYTRLEAVARRMGRGALSLRLWGVVCLVCVVGGTGLVVYGLISLPFVGTLLAVYLAYAGLATRSLLQFFGVVLEKVETAPLEEAQRALSMLVSRDTFVLDRNALRKSLADTLTENFTDAVVAPLFWLCVAGPVGLWMYKAVSTADSMWGYKTPQWLHLGWAGARMDDMLAFVPARVGMVFLYMTDALTGCAQKMGGVWPGIRTIACEAHGMESPNSGWPMSACAWLMGAPLGGSTQYFGAVVEKPWVGPRAKCGCAERPWTRTKLETLACLVERAAVLACVCMVCAMCVIIFIHIV